MPRAPEPQDFTPRVPPPIPPKHTHKPRLQVITSLWTSKAHGARVPKPPLLLESQPARRLPHLRMPPFQLPTFHLDPGTLQGFETGEPVLRPGADEGLRSRVSESCGRDPRRPPSPGTGPWSTQLRRGGGAPRFLLCVVGATSGGSQGSCTQPYPDGPRHASLHPSPGLAPPTARRPRPSCPAPPPPRRPPSQLSAESCLLPAALGHLVA